MPIKLHPLPAAPSPGRTYLEQLQRRKNKGKQRQEVDAITDGDIDASLYAESGIPPVLKALRNVKLHQNNHAESPTNAEIQAVVYDDGDELAWSTSTLVWSQGSAVHRIYSFKEREHGQIRQALFAYFELPAPPSISAATSASSHIPPTSSTTPSLSDPSSASTTSDDSLFGAFAPTPPPAWSDDTRSSLASASIGASHTSSVLVRVLCIFFAETLHLYFPDGSQQIVHLRFAIRKAWAMENGLLIERLHKPTLRDSLPDWLGSPELRNRGRQREDIALYTLLDPFGDFSPFTKVSSLHNLLPSRHKRSSLDLRKATTRSGKITPFNNPTERVLFVSDRRKGQEPILVTYNTDTNKLSIWAYAEIGEDVQSEFEAFRRRQTQLAEEEGYIDPSPGKNGHGNSILPSVTRPVTGKRRRSQDYAFNIGPNLPSAPPLHAQPRRVSALSNASDRTQQADRRRSGHGDLTSHPLLHAYPNNSISEFLELMGTQPASRQRSAQLATGMNRRSSTAASNISLAPIMNRRTSTTRNELSISLDRMALSSAAAAAAAAAGGGASSGTLPPRSNTVNMHDISNGNLQPHLPNSQGGEIGIAETLAEEAQSQSKDHPMGHGEMEREASVLLDEDDEVQERASEMNIARLASLKLDDLSYVLLPGL
jgi:hypothetical protein